MMNFKLFKSKVASAVVFFAAAFCVYADISFENPDLNQENKVLFTVNHKINGSPSYSTGFIADAASLSGVKILTCYPEKMELLSKGAVLQVRNRYGTARYSTADSTISWVTRTDSIPCLSEKQAPQSVSPDGKWICYVKKNGAAEGELILKNASTLQEVVLNKKTEFSWEKTGVLWNPDSSSLLYEKNGSIYFCDPKAAFQKVQLTEEYRKIGEGTINSVYWANSKTLIYIDRDLVYKISSSELYTRGLYSNMVGAGTVSGRLPVNFDPLHDSFSVNNRVTNLVVIQADRIVSLFRLDSKGFEYLSALYSKPVTNSTGTVIEILPFWSQDSKCYLWIKTLGYEDGHIKASVYSISNDLHLIAVMNGASDPVFSSDKKKVCYGQGESLFVYEISSWKAIGRLDGEKFISYVWASDNSLYAGGTKAVHYWKLSAEKAGGEDEVLFLSSADRVFWTSDTSVCAVVKGTKDQFFDLDMSSGRWTKSEKQSAGEASVQNGRYRVFTGTTPNQKFSNCLYVRTLSGKAVTRALFPDASVKSEPLKKVFLAVDASDDAAGLSRILAVLKKYNVKATFFVNGEFIRRYPKECGQIVKSGYDCGAMFFTNADLTGKGFVISEDFIRRGLARNEDEFFAATGKELNLLWHAPFYKANQEIKNAGVNCGYRYVEAGRYSLDTITLEEAARGKPGYMSASQIIDFYAENVVDGDVIPVSAGISAGSRTDYLYEKLDLLLGTLLNQGFEIAETKQY